MKNKTKKALCAASILGVVAISGIFAYLTDTDSATNNFTVGEVKIELQEPTWDAALEEDEDYATHIVANQEFTKDPQVENVGANDAYVFLSVTVPKATVVTADEDGILENDGEARETVLFTFDIDEENWCNIANEEGENSNTIIYFYKTGAISPEETTEPLFESVKFVNIIDGEIAVDTAENIVINAYAIQKDAIPDTIDINSGDGKRQLFNIISHQNNLGIELEMK